MLFCLFLSFQQSLFGQTSYDTVIYYYRGYDKLTYLLNNSNNVIVIHYVGTVDKNTESIVLYADKDIDLKIDEKKNFVNDGNYFCKMNDTIFNSIYIYLHKIYKYNKNINTDSFYNGGKNIQAFSVTFSQRGVWKMHYTILHSNECMKLFDGLCEIVCNNKKYINLSYKIYNMIGLIANRSLIYNK